MVMDRKYYHGKHGSKNTIYNYKLGSVDDEIDDDNKIYLFPLHLWEYQSKIRKATADEISDYEMKKDATKYNL